MLTLRDFFHLPQVDPILTQITSERTGLILVAGMDPRPHTDSARVIPSGRAGIFRILIRQVLEEHPGLSATIVAVDRSIFRVPRGMGRRVDFKRVTPSTDYADLIPALAGRGLLIIDRLTPENAPIVLEAARRDIRVISQVDTVFRGAAVTRSLRDWGVNEQQLTGPRWVIAVRRIPMLCSCRTTAVPDPILVEALQQRYPFLQIDPYLEYALPAQCKTCEYTGRHNDITAFDFYRADPDRPFTQTSVLPLEAYMLGLAERGDIPLSDLASIESDQLRRTYHLLTASEHALADSTAQLERKIVELETANRVLQNRTEELVSLQELGQALIGSKTLRALAQQVCRQASQICGADRAVFYFLRGNDRTGNHQTDEHQADVLATHGWAPGRVPLQVSAAEVCDPGGDPTPKPHNAWPPGVKPLHPDAEGLRLRAGLKVPLIAQGQPVGAMIVHSGDRPRFNPGAVALLQTFANQAAIAIQRAGLVENLQENISALEAAQEGLAQKERMDRELELARAVQQAVLPSTFPAISGYRFAARNQPARQVGGDFYDVIDLGKNCFGLVIADVSDKGIPAAVYMALTRSLMLAESRRAASPVDVLENVNNLLIELGQARMFVTIFYAVVDGDARVLTYARAGHDLPLLVRAGKVQPLTGEGALIGFFDAGQLHLTEHIIDLEPGDRLVLYTDGLTDITSPDGARFGPDRLHALLGNLGPLPAAEFSDAIFQALTDHQGPAVQFDDMTLLITEVLDT